MQEDSECIVLDAGDQFVGTLFANVFQGVEAVRAVESLGNRCFCKLAGGLWACNSQRLLSLGA